MINSQQRIWTGKLERGSRYAWVAALLIFFPCFSWAPPGDAEVDVRHQLADLRDIVKPTDTTRIRAPGDLGRRQVNEFLHNYLPEHPELAVTYDLGASTVKSWAVNNKDGELQKTLEQYLFKHQLEWSIADYAYQAGHPAGNIVRGRIAAQQGQLSPYDGLVRKYADKYGFDWRLIVAQMFQESQFDPGALSYAGAEGLMQVMPATATSIGAANLADPEANIHTGIKYLSLLRNRFASDSLLEERIWFLLASYNAGPGRVNLARRKAAEMGLDPNRWFGNVETAMLALAKPVEKDGEMVRNCRCGQTVVYVKEIRRLYHNYVRLTRADQVAHLSVFNISPYDI